MNLRVARLTMVLLAGSVLSGWALPNPIGWWEMDDGSGTNVVDSSGNGHNGTFYNSPSWTSGVLNGAVQFALDKSVQIPYWSGFQLTNAMTLAVWIKLAEAVTEPYTEYDIFGTGQYYNGWGLRYYYRGNVIFQMTGANGNSIISGVKLPTNQWVHIVGTFDGTNASLYVNGQLDRRQAWSGQVLTNSSGVTFGQFPAAMDDAQIYDRSLSESEVIQLYAQGDQDLDGLADVDESACGTSLTARDTDGDGYADGIEIKVGTDPTQSSSAPNLTNNLVGWWPINEGAGTTTADATGNGNTGTLSGSPVWTTGVLSNALSFNGSNTYVTAGASGTNNVLAITTNAFTVSYWANVSVKSQQVVLAAILNRREYSPASLGYAISWDTTWQRVTCGLIGVGYQDWNAPVIYFSDISTNLWHHYAYSYSGTQIVSYLNGTEMRSTAASNNLTASPTALYFAQDRYAGMRWKGKLDEPRIYRRSFTAGEIWALSQVDDDADGLPNSQELRLGTNPSNADDDGDGLPDGWEVVNGLNPLSNDAAGDPDGDGLSNVREYALGMNPAVNDDTDNDFWTNAAEVQAGTSTNDAASHPDHSFVINGGLDVVKSTQLQVAVVLGIVAQSIIFSEDIAFSAPVTNAFAQDFYYTLSNTNDGLHTVYLRLLKSSGTNSPIFGRSVLLDTAGPSLAITAPTNGTVTAQRRLTLQGFGADADNTHTNTDPKKPLAVTINDAFANDRETNGVWSSGTHELTPGTNDFIVVAADRAGFSVTNTVMVIYNPSLATNVPVFTTGMTNSVVTVGSNTTTFAVAGAIDEDNAIVRIDVLDAVDNTITNAGVIAAVHGTNWWGEVPVVPGSNIVVITAQNAGSASVSNSFSMVQNPDVVLVITNPTAYAVANAGSITVSGFASGNFDGAITINGQAASKTAVSGGYIFVGAMTIDNIGANVIDVQAHSSAGSIASARQTVYGYEVVGYRWDGAAEDRHLADDCWFTRHYPYDHEYRSESASHDTWEAPASLVEENGYYYEYTFEEEEIDCFACGESSGTDEWDPEWYPFDAGWFRYEALVNGEHLDGAQEWFDDCPHEADCLCEPDPYCTGQSTIICCVPEAHEHTLSDETRRTEFTFIKHWPVDEEQTVILHLEESEYLADAGWSSDPSQVKLWGQPGIAYSETGWGSTNIGFVIKIKTNTRYTIRDGDLTVPMFQRSEDYAWPNAESRYTSHFTGQYLYFAKIANEQVTVKIVSTDPDISVLCAGCEMQFFVETTPPNRPVVWSVRNDETAAATIDGNGRLTIGAWAGNGNLDIRAADQADPTVFDERSIFVFVPPQNLPRERVARYGDRELTQAEISYLDNRWDFAVRMWQIDPQRAGWTALDAAITAGHIAPADREDPYMGNAFLHAFINCLVAENFDVIAAKDFWDAHEWWDGNTCQNASMDFHNNGVGRQLSRESGGTCAEKVLQAIQAGRLRWMSKQYDPSECPKFISTP